MHVILRFACALLVAGTSVSLHAAPTLALASGQPQSFSLPSGSFTNNFFIDVPASSQRLTLEVTGNTGADIDLLLHSASAFPDAIGGQPPTATQLFDAAQYRSQSLEASEKLVITRANKFPVRAGRWFVSVINFGPAAATSTITATLSDIAPAGGVPIEVVFNDASDGCGVSEWTNGTGRTPINGNPGTTLGTQRQAAINEALRIIRTEIKSELPIRVQACWENLGTGSSITVARAGPRQLLAEEPWMPQPNTWYAGSAATKLGGARSCGLLGGSCAGTYDIRVTFNDQIDTSTVPQDFYYGFTSNSNLGTIDFVAVAMHEIAHGLGFISTVNTRPDSGPVGQRLEGRNDAFGHNLVGVNESDSSTRRFMDMSDAERAAAITGFDRLRWDDLRAVNSARNNAASFGAPLSFIFMHTPSPVVPGSSLSHVGLRHSGDLMNASVSRGQRDLSLGGPMLQAVGWSETAPAGAPNPVLPASNILFDVRRDGHGIEFVRVRDSLYALTLYTYGADGQPEFFQAVGNMVNSQFVAFPDANGKTLFRSRSTPGASPPQQQVSELSGTVSLDFNEPATQAPCNDGRDPSGAVAVMTFSLGADQNIRWCMQPIVAASARPTPDFSGLWYAGSADDGWGWSILNFRAGSQTGLSALLFYYDGAGNSSFAYAQTALFANGAPVPVFHRRGYCRTCPTVAFADQPAGSVTFNFTVPSESETANNRVTYSVTPQNSVGGTFARSGSPFLLLTQPQ